MNLTHTHSHVYTISDSLSLSLSLSLFNRSLNLSLSLSPFLSLFYTHTYIGAITTEQTNTIMPFLGAKQRSGFKCMVAHVTCLSASILRCYLHLIHIHFLKRKKKIHTHSLIAFINWIQVHGDSCPLFERLHFKVLFTPYSYTLSEKKKEHTYILSDRLYSRVLSMHYKYALGKHNENINICIYIYIYIMSPLWAPAF